jgi:hypothetical protein
MEMPPLPLMVLDGLADDIESVGSLRDHGEVPPYGLALVDEREVLDALSELLRDGLVTALKIDDTDLVPVRVAAPGTDSASLRRYWFKWTMAGEAAWREGREQLDAYWEAHAPDAAS